MTHGQGVPTLGDGSPDRATHHFFSDTELAVFLLLEWNPDVIDIREQFPLRIEDTLSLAEQANTRHAQAGGYHQVLSSDFVVDLSKPTGPPRLE